MTFNLDLNTVLSGLTVLGVAGTIKLLWQMNVKIARQNGRLDKSEGWQAQHESRDDERHVEIRENLKEIWKKVDSL